MARFIGGFAAIVRVPFPTPTIQVTRIFVSIIRSRVFKDAVDYPIIVDYVTNLIFFEWSTHFSVKLIQSF